MQKVLFQATPDAHTLLNNGGCEAHLIKLNIGHRFIFKVSILPLPHVWIRVPMLGELQLGFVHFIQQHTDKFEPDSVGFEASLTPWGELSTKEKRQWEALTNPKLNWMGGSADYWQAIDRIMHSQDINCFEAQDLYWENPMGDLVPKRG